MSTLQTLNRQLQVGAELLSVVGTMKGLAAVSIHEFEVAVRALREYTTTVELGLQILLSTRPELIPEETRMTGRVVALVVGTDQGLCGPINREIAREADQWFETHQVAPGERMVVSLGARASLELDLVGLVPDQEIPLPGSVEAIGPLVEDLLVRIDRWRQLDSTGRVVVFFQRALGRTQRTPRVHQVVPPDVRRLRGIAARQWPTRMIPGFPHEPEDLLAGLLRQDLFIALYRSVAEAKAAEHGARLAAMQVAEQNIEERLERLGTEYHHLRQAEITEQILDVVSGFEALRKR
ncbi:MAG: F0F1 ATP synthase subunit gamma [Actinomycetota bacterium]